MTKELGVVVPFIGHDENRATFLCNLADTFIKNSISAKVIVISDQKDSHLKIEDYSILKNDKLMDLLCVTNSLGNGGYGRLIRNGAALLDTKYILIAFPDGTANLSHIPQLIAAMRSGADLSIVNRFTKMTSPNLAKRFQWIFKKVIYLSSGVKLFEDSTYAYRIFDKATYDSLAISGTSWDFFAEQTIKTTLIGGKISMIDGEFTNPQFGNERFSIFFDSLRYFRLVIRTSLHKLGLPWY